MSDQPLKNGDKRNPDGTFAKGYAGGPGRPKGSLSLVQLIKERLEMVGPDQKRTIAEHFIDNILQDALDGKDLPIKIIMQYVEGMPKQAVEVDNKGLPFVIKIMQDDGSTTAAGENS